VAVDPYDLRPATPDDVPAVCAFGERHVRAHYTPLIGADAADAQVRSWWNEDAIRSAVDAGLVVVATHAGRVVGVGQRGRRGEDHVVYKLYVDPAHRGHGLGPRVLATLEAQLPASATALHLEHFAANERAGAFYERQGFELERVERSSTGDPRTAIVWRSRRRHAAGTDLRDHVEEAG
jgi:GNAT superfamily N-acetyltransferase